MIVRNWIMRLASYEMLNVNRDINDPFYRYKMPGFEVKIEGRGNGIKTLILNLGLVGKALDRPPDLLCKYLGIELGAGTIINDVEGKYIINGEFEVGRLQVLLDGFIKKFVLCGGCGNPETKFRITSKKLIESKCIACGYICFIPMVHKLTTYMVNKGGTKLTRVERRALKQAKTDSKQEGSRTGRKMDEGNQSNVDQGACGKVGEDDAVGEDDNGDEDEEEEEEEWSVDVSDEAIQLRTKELGTGVAHLTMTDDLDKSMSERLGIFHTFVKKRLSSKEIIGEALRLECSDKCVMILVQELWSTADDVVEKMAKYQGLFQRFTLGKPKAQMYILQSIEKLIELDPSKLNKVPHYLKQLYDLDLVDEDIFIEWGLNPGKNISNELSSNIQRVSNGFLHWLKNAEEEDSSEDETVTFNKLGQVLEPVQLEELVSDDDFNIDDL